MIRREQDGKEDIPLLDLLPGERDIFGGKTRSRCGSWVMQIPSIASIYLYALMETEPALCDALCSHLEAATERNEIRFLVAIYMAALRVALEEWLEQEARGDLVSLLGDYLDSFSSLSHNA
jgi:hypothetical protein